MDLCGYRLIQINRRIDSVLRVMHSLRDHDGELFWVAQESLC